jgi:hypothetical protein
MAGRSLDDTDRELRAAGGLQGRIGETPDRDWRPTLRDRLKKQIDHFAQEERRASKANELVDLLEKNPDVARILELVEDLQA